MSLKKVLTLTAAPNRAFVLFAMLAAFCISGEYAITRPASTGLFLTFFSADHLPTVWLATVPLNLLVVYLYNRFLPRFGPLKMLTTVVLIVIAINTSCAFLLSSFPWLIFLQFVCKDIYILLMFKQLWSLIHVSVEQKNAKFLYGLIYGVGTAGSILCSSIPSFSAVAIGSETLFLLTCPLYLMLLFAYRMAFRRSPLATGNFAETLTLDPRPKEALTLFKRNRFLIGVLLLVVFMQVSTGLLEYQFNTYLEHNIVDKDLRTAYCGKITGIVNILSGCFQFFGSWLMMHFLGLRGSHLFIPLVLLSNTLFFALIPTFAIISFSFVFLKSIDFSLFGVIREMLYIPLKTDEKFRAKAVIDVFAYRTSKAVVSLFIISLQLIAGVQILPVVTALSIAVFLGWLTMAFRMFKQQPLPSAQSVPTAENNPR